MVQCFIRYVAFTIIETTHTCAMYVVCTGWPILGIEYWTFTLIKFSIMWSIVLLKFVSNFPFSVFCILISFSFCAFWISWFYQFSYANLYKGCRLNMIRRFYIINISKYRFIRAFKRITSMHSGFKWNLPSCTMQRTQLDVLFDYKILNSNFKWRNIWSLNSSNE